MKIRALCCETKKTQKKGDSPCLFCKMDILKMSKIDPGGYFYFDFFYLTENHIIVLTELFLTIYRDGCGTPVNSPDCQ